MSERGSFTTEYIYCTKCLEALKPILMKDDKYLHGVQIPSYSSNFGGYLPIIAGKVGGLGMGEEAWVFQFELVDQICEAICHRVRIAVLCESGENKVFTFVPAEDDPIPQIEQGEAQLVDPE